MARAKNLQPRGRLRRGGPGGRDRRRRWLAITASIMTVAASFAAGISLSAFGGTVAGYAGIGGLAAVAVFRFLEFYAGVFSLVSLSLTVMGGLLATDRLVLAARHRVLLYAVHRALAATSVIFLVVHVLTKLVERHAGPIDVVVPFLADRRATYVGLGTIAGYLMMIVVWTGIIRWRFAGLSHPWLWRVLHSAAYLAWPVALLHGLRAGREAKTWVNLSYLLCLFVVALALAVRLAMSRGRRMRAPRATTSGTIRPVGRLDADRPTAGRSVGRDRPNPRRRQAGIEPPAGRSVGRDRANPRRRQAGIEPPAVSPADAQWLASLRADGIGRPRRAPTTADYWGTGVPGVGGGADVPGEHGEHRSVEDASRPPELVDLAASLRATRESLAGMAGRAPAWRRSRQAF